MSGALARDDLPRSPGGGDHGGDTGCLAVDCWVSEDQQAVVTTGQWESEQALRAGFAAVRTAELKRAPLVRAAAERVSVSEVIRRAIGEYLRAS